MHVNVDGEYSRLQQHWVTWIGKNLKGLVDQLLAAISNAARPVAGAADAVHGLLKSLKPLAMSA